MASGAYSSGGRGSCPGKLGSVVQNRGQGQQHGPGVPGVLMFNLKLEGGAVVGVRGEGR